MLPAMAPGSRRWSRSGFDSERGVRHSFGAFARGIACGLAIRHDHGSQYLSDVFQGELGFLGLESSPALVRAP